MTAGGHESLGWPERAPGARGAGRPGGRSRCAVRGIWLGARFAGAALSSSPLSELLELVHAVPRRRPCRSWPWSA